MNNKIIKYENIIKKIILTLISVFSFSFIYSQTETNLRDEALNIYLDTYNNVEYIKENITFVNYVRDSKEADVHILETSQDAGNGGDEYTYIFIGNYKFAGKNDTLKFYTTADNTNDEIRQKQVKLLKIGLMQYVAHTPYADKLSISFTDNSTQKTPVDKWKSWVFNLEAYYYITSESSFESYDIWTEVNANRITEDWKIEVNYSYYFNNSTYSFEDTSIIGQKEMNYFNALVAKTIGNHWAAGFKGDLGNSTYNNKSLFVGFWPTVEYNIFPYSKSNIIQFRFQYLIGPKYYKYYETTIFDKTEQLVYHHYLGIAFQINKKWGDINTSISGQQYFHDLSKYSLNFNTGLNIRLIKGLSVSFYSSYSIIHDQFYLPKGDLTYEEILLRKQQMETSYNYWISCGFTYTFGSIYNNIVNPRFNSIE